jgi:hypothetical protein
VREINRAGGVDAGRSQRPAGARPRRIVVSGRTHRVRPENETENEVTVVIEEKGGKG